MSIIDRLSQSPISLINRLKTGQSTLARPQAPKPLELGTDFNEMKSDMEELIKGNPDIKLPEITRMIDSIDEFKDKETARKMATQIWSGLKSELKDNPLVMAVAGANKNSEKELNKFKETFPKKLAEDTKNKFPFTDLYKFMLNDITYENQQKKPMNVFKTEETEAPPAFYTESTDSKLDNVITINTDNKILEQIASISKNNPLIAQKIMSHEMLHRLFRVKIGDIGFEGNVRESPYVDDNFKTFNQKWDKAKEKYPTLNDIDAFLKTKNYNIKNNRELGTERFAYLGQNALYDGIDVIPKELMEFYKDIIKSNAQYQETNRK